MAAVTLALVGFFAFLILRVTAPQMTPLFTDLSYEDSSAIVKDLERQGVAYELRNDGGTIMVPKDRVARLRMSLAGEGLPKGGGVGYEIFDKSDALGTTSFIQNINNLRALEGELARTIRGLDRVVAARVHLVLPERPLFSRDKVEPSASIVLKVHGALEPQQVRAIRHLVASAVKGLKPQRVSIVDEAGRLLADGTGNDEFGEVTVDERRASFEKRLRDRFLGRRSRPRAHPSQRRFRFQSHHGDFGQIRSGGACGALEPDARGDIRNREPRQSGDGRQRNTRRRQSAATAAAGCHSRSQCPAPRSEQKIRRNRQLRDIENDQDRSDRGRPHQPHLGGGPGGRRLR
jgi:type III secretory pathway lipoprotein EscJ